MILITGGHGFLGSFLSKSLKKDKYEVLCLGRDKLNVLNKESVDKGLRRVRH